MSTGRLEKLLGMLGSDYEGERANAAKMIADMAKAQGKTIVELVMGDGPIRIVEKIVYRDAPEARSPRQSTYEGPILAGLERAVRAERQSVERNGQGFMSSWEVEFARDMLDRYWSDSFLTVKQAAICERIINKMKRHDSDPII